MLPQKRTSSSPRVRRFVLNRRLGTVVGRCGAGSLRSAPLCRAGGRLQHRISQSSAAAVVAVGQVQYFRVPKILNVPSKNLSLHYIVISNSP